MLAVEIGTSLFWTIVIVVLVLGVPPIVALWRHVRSLNATNAALENELELRDEAFRAVLSGIGYDEEGQDRPYVSVPSRVTSIVSDLERRLKNAELRAGSLPPPSPDCHYIVGADRAIVVETRGDSVTRHAVAFLRFDWDSLKSDEFIQSLQNAFNTLVGNSMDSSMRPPFVMDTDTAVLAKQLGTAYSPPVRAVISRGGLHPDQQRHGHVWWPTEMRIDDTGGINLDRVHTLLKEAFRQAISSMPVRP